MPELVRGLAFEMDIHQLPSRTFTGRNEGGYFVGLLWIKQFGNAFCSWSI